MPISDYEHPPEAIAELRRRFEEKLLEEDHRQFDPLDVQEVLSWDWWFIRHLNNAHGKQSMALERLVSNLKWRHSNHFRHLDENHFPDEFYRRGAVFRHTVDVHGQRTFYIRICMMVPAVPSMMDSMKKFLAHQMFTIDRETAGQGWALILDFHGASRANVDFEMTKYIIQILQLYYPSGIAYALCVDLPWYMRALWTVIKQMIPANSRHYVKFTDRKKIEEIVARDQLPDFLGGQCTRPFSGNEVVPTGAPTFVEFMEREMGMDSAQANKIADEYEELYAKQINGSKCAQKAGKETEITHIESV